MPAAQVCTAVQGGTWTGRDASGGSATWDCGAGAPSPEDDWVIPASTTVIVSGQLGSEAAPLAGSVTVAGTLSLDAAAQASVFAAGDWTFLAGSDGRWMGNELAPHQVPTQVRFPTATTIRFDFPEPQAPPWEICDSARSDCGWDTVHPRDADPGQEKSATLIYFPFPDVADASRVNDNAGRMFEVIDVDDCTPLGRSCRSFTLVLHRTGPDHGVWHFGADGNAPGIDVGPGEAVRGTAALQWAGDWSELYPGCTHFTPGDTVDRSRDSFVADGASRDTSGCRLRNGLASEGDYTVTDVVVHENERGQLRYEIRVEPDAISDDHELQAMLACVGDDPSDPGSERWCARITRTRDDWNDDAPGADDAFVVWRDPRAVLSPGDELAVYYARPFPGDAIVPVNPHFFDGARTATFTVRSGSELGDTHPIHGLLWQRLDQNVNGWRHQDPGDTSFDLVWGRHFGGATPRGTTKMFVFGSTGIPGERADAANLSITRVYSTFPNWPGSDLEEFAQEGAIRLITRNAAISPGNPEPDLWTGTRIRQIRTEGSSGLLFMQAGIYDDCPDGVIAQDLLNAHGHLYRGNVDDVPGAEDIEWQGATRSCDVHRVAIASATRGNPVVARQRDSPDATWKSRLASVVISGVNDSFETDDDDDNDGQGPASAVAKTHPVAETFIVTNYLSDGGVTDSVSHHYGAYIGWFNYRRDGDPGDTLGGVGRCGDSIGMFMVGGVLESGQAFGCTHDSLGTVPPHARWMDSTLLNLFEGSGAWPYSVGSGAELPSQSMTWERLLFHFRAEAEGPTLARLIGWPAGVNRPAWTIDRIVHVNRGAASPDGLLFRSSDFFSSLRLGPNLYFITEQGSAGFRCRDENGADPIVTSGEACELQAAFDPSGSTGGTSGAHQAHAGAQPIPPIFAPEDVGDPEALVASFGEWTGTWEDSCAQQGGPESCSLLESLPRWSGPYAYEWPFAWHTVDPLPGFRRTAPLFELVPPYVTSADSDGDGVPDLVDGEIATAAFVAPSPTGGELPSAGGEGFADGAELTAGSGPNAAVSVPTLPGGRAARILLIAMLLAGGWLSGAARR